MGRRSWLIFAMLWMVWPTGSVRASGVTLELDCAKIRAGELVELEGDWGFQWKEASLPYQWMTPHSDHASLPVPGLWESEARVQGAEAPYFGFGTYWVELSIQGDCPEELGLVFPLVVSAFRGALVWPDGSVEPFSGAGSFGPNVRESIHQHRPVQVRFAPGERRSVQIVLHVSKFNGRVGGITMSPKIGSYRQVVLQEKFRTYRNFFVIGILVLTGITHLLFYFFGRPDMRTLFFSVVCLVMAARVYIVEGYIDDWFSDPGDWLYEFRTRCDWGSYAVLLYLFFSFFEQSFPNTCGESGTRFFLPRAVRSS